MTIPTCDGQVYHVGLHCNLDGKPRLFEILEMEIESFLVLLRWVLEDLMEEILNGP
jgi:hypothetical protein